MGRMRRIRARAIENAAATKLRIYPVAASGVVSFLGKSRF